MPARWFRIAYAENALRRVAQSDGLEIPRLRAPQALTLELDFYRGHRAQHARLRDEGDGLLWQWGPDADATRFTIGLTRQLVREDDTAITQLRLVLSYRWTPSRHLLGHGHLWCFDPLASIAFERQVRASAAYRAVASAVPSDVTLRTQIL
ncbi:MAG TPA: hypothetical protein VN759_11070 [Pseudolysinimonas sp.]|nr:hypothetical protein [Pseudolysinimonas sp.]